MENKDFNYDNWVILRGDVISEPIKVCERDNIFYNFRIDNQNFKMNCTLTLFEEDKEMEDAIFSTIKQGNTIKVSGKLFMKKKGDKLWVQINVKNWIYEEGDRKQLFRV